MGKKILTLIVTMLLAMLVTGCGSDSGSGSGSGGSGSDDYVGIFEVMPDEYAALENMDAGNIKSIDYTKLGETAMTQKTVTDDEMIELIFRDLIKIQIARETDTQSCDLDEGITLNLLDGKSYTFSFNDRNLTTDGKYYEIRNAEDLWAAIYAIEEE